VTRDDPSSHNSFYGLRLATDAGCSTDDLTPRTSKSSGKIFCDHGFSLFEVFNTRRWPYHLGSR